MMVVQSELVDALVFQVCDQGSSRVAARFHPPSYLLAYSAESLATLLWN